MKMFIITIFAVIIGCNNSSKSEEVKPNVELPSYAIPTNYIPSISLGGMSVNFPNPNQWQNKKVYIPNFGNTVYHYMMNVNDTEGGYMVAWVDYPIPQKTLAKLSNSDLQDVLKGGRDGAVSNVNGKLIWDKESNLSGIPGREFSCVAYEQGIKFLVHAKLFLKGSRLFQFLSISPINNCLNDEKFFESISAQ